jgi:hypothetical protein
MLPEWVFKFQCLAYEELIIRTAADNITKQTAFCGKQNIMLRVSKVQ